MHWFLVLMIFQGGYNSNSPAMSIVPDHYTSEDDCRAAGEIWSLQSGSRREYECVGVPDHGEN